MTVLIAEQVDNQRTALANAADGYRLLFPEDADTLV